MYFLHYARRLLYLLLYWPCLLNLLQYLPCSLYLCTWLILFSPLSTLFALHYPPSTLLTLLSLPSTLPYLLGYQGSSFHLVHHSLYLLTPLLACLLYWLYFAHSVHYFTNFVSRVSFCQCFNRPHIECIGIFRRVQVPWQCLIYISRRNLACSRINSPSLFLCHSSQAYHSPSFLFFPFTLHPMLPPPPPLSCQFFKPQMLTFQCRWWSIFNPSASSLPGAITVAWEFTNTVR